MSLLLNKKINESSSLAIWNINESIKELCELSTENFPEITNPKRLSERIASRLLINSLCHSYQINYEGITKSETGKPFLLNHPAHISISHSFPYAAAIINKKKPCGIDIEKPRKQMLTIQNRFLHSSELEFQNNLEKLCIIWSTKETIYKIGNQNSFNFKESISLSFLEGNRIKGKVFVPNKEIIYDIRYEWINGFLLTYAV